MKNNPFVGPKPLKRGDPLFGRKRETAELRYLLSAERIVLLYSPSGAGKSSLVAAGLIPDIDERFDVWPVLRIGEQPPEGSAWNRYVWNAANAIGQSESAPSTITECVARRERKHRNILLIFDQFEEFLRFDPTGIEAKQLFIVQLADLLRDPTIWALFMLREDYLAQIDPYAVRLPTRLKNRYRIDLLDCDHAAETIAELAATQQVTFEPGVVDTLVNDLSAGTGLYVEPLALQVVCQRMWDELPETNIITAAAAKNYGDPTTALSEYYAKQIREVCKGGLNEAEVRNWFQHKLITADRVRRQLMVKGSSVEGLDIETVRALETAHLLRKDTRSGVDWYELAHDRLIDPIRASNEQSLTPEQKQAALWNEQNHPATLLLRGSALRKAARTPDTADFLNASRKAANRRLALYTSVACVMIVIVSMALWAWRERQSAVAAQIVSDSQRIAAEAMQQRDVRLDLAFLLSVEAGHNANTYEARNALITMYQTNPRLKAHLHTDNRLDAFRLSPSGRLLAAKELTGPVVLWDMDLRRPRPFTIGDRAVDNFGFSRDSSRVATLTGRVVRIFDASNGRLLSTSTIQSRAYPETMRSSAIGAGFRLAFVNSDTHTLTLQDPDGGNVINTSACPSMDRIGFDLLGHYVLCMGNGEIGVYDIAKGTFRQERIALGVEPAERLENAAIAATGAPVAIVSRQNGEMRLRYRNPLTGTPAAFSLGTQTPVSISLTWDGRMAAVGDYIGKIRLLSLVGEPGESQVEAHQGYVWRVVFMPSGDLISLGWDGIRLWDVSHRNPFGRSFGGSIRMSNVQEVRVRPDAKEMAVVDRTGLLCRMSLAPGDDAKDAQCVKAANTRALAWKGSALKAAQGLLWMAYLPDGREILSGYHGPPLLNGTPWKAVAVDPARMDGPMDVSAKGIVAEACYSGDVCVWRAAEPEKAFRLHAFPRPITALAFSPSGATLAAGDEQGSIRLWDTAAWRVGTVLKGHAAHVTSLRFNPAGTMLVSGSLDETLQLWEVASEAPLGNAMKLGEKMPAAAFGSGDDLVVVAGEESGVYDLRRDIQLRRVCSVANRNLTIDEWRKYVSRNLPYEKTCPQFPAGN